MKQGWFNRANTYKQATACMYAHDLLPSSGFWLSGKTRKKDCKKVEKGLCYITRVELEPWNCTDSGHTPFVTKKSCSLFDSLLNSMFALQSLDWIADFLNVIPVSVWVRSLLTSLRFASRARATSSAEAVETLPWHQSDLWHSCFTNDNASNSLTGSVGLRFFQNI